MLLFIHMHKCAGSTVRKSAELSGLRLPERHGNGNLIDSTGRAMRYARSYPGLVRQTLEYQRHLGVQFMAIEMDFPDISGVPDDVTVFTVLRDPFQRAVSNFRFAKGRGAVDPDVPFREFFNGGYTHGGQLSRSANYYVRKLNQARPLDALRRRHLHRALQILARFNSVIMLGRDNLPEALAALGIDKFGTLKVSNPDDSGLSPEQMAVSEADQYWFEKRNKLDRQLFEFVNRPDWRAEAEALGQRSDEPPPAEEEDEDQEDAG